jgi:hypothetical protein
MGVGFFTGQKLARIEEWIDTQEMKLVGQLQVSDFEGFLVMHRAYTEYLEQLAEIISS